jgi:acid phosphatase
MRKRVAWLIAVAVLGASGCATVSHEPRNLGDLKAEISRYVESGEYARQIAHVAEKANAWVEHRAGRRAEGERLAIVFDVDETLLSNLPTMTREDFGYVPAVWDAWVDEARAPAIEPVREVYRTARRFGVAVFFITGREEASRVATARNLQAVGCGEYEALICKPKETVGSSAAFKLKERRRIEAEGYVIIANVGDQESDLSGGAAERNFKVPAPFYRTE